MNGNMEAHHGRRLWGDLTAREHEVLALLAAGERNGTIAARLGLSLNTVERHVNHIFAKIGADNRVQAANYAHAREVRREPPAQRVH
jgi:DNA-binding CsgD family transcriptional regulator